MTPDNFQMGFNGKCYFYDSASTGAWGGSTATLSAWSGTTAAYLTWGAAAATLREADGVSSVTINPNIKDSDVSTRRYAPNSATAYGQGDPSVTFDVISNPGDPTYDAIVGYRLARAYMPFVAFFTGDKSTAGSLGIYANWKVDYSIDQPIGDKTVLKVTLKPGPVIPVQFVRVT